MPRILSPQRQSWYDELHAVAYYSETDLEKALLQHVSGLFPDYHVFPFKKHVTHKYTGEVRAPDLAMIRKDLSSWSIVEVELEAHALKDVLRQTRVFADGDYNAAEIAEYVRRQLFTHCGRRLTLTRLGTLIGANTPKITVISDLPNEDWEKTFKDEGVQFCVFELYKDTSGDYLYRTSGAYPISPVSTAHCRVSRLPNAWEVVGVGFEFRRLGRNKSISVIHKDRASQWAVLEIGVRRYLRFLGKINPLNPINTYSLILDRGNRYFFQLN